VYFRKWSIDVQHPILVACDYIEAHLDRRLTLEEIARAAFLSPYHFHRIFSQVAGRGVMSYVRERRLTEAADLLLNTDRPVADIALNAQFGSQSSFTRAFKQLFGVAPAAYRRRRPCIALRRVVPIQPSHLERLMNRTVDEPTIVEFSGAWVLGLSGEFRPFDPAIPALWQRYLKLAGELDLELGPRGFGVCISLESNEAGHTERIRYLAGDEICAEPASVPEPFETLRIDPGSFAVFTHRGPIAEIHQTVRHIWSVWAPKADHALRGAPDFELYDERFKADSPDSELDIYIPVEV
jgi:AraC family transcriptional regulator